ncbi:MAG TPA: MFS transporter [Candidatus Limnocylindrales bacterium]
MTSSTHEPTHGTLERMGLTALGYPPFVTYSLANLTSNASWFIFGAALNTYIFQVTGSAQTVGIASFIYSLPFALFMLHAGLLADRFGAKRMVVLSLAGAGLAIVATGLLALGGFPLWSLVVLGCVMSLFQTLGAPAYISIVNDLVPPRAISSGVALTFLGFNVGRIIGGIIGGLLLATLSGDIVTSAALTIVVAGVMQSVPSLPISRLRVSETVARTTDHSMMRPLVEAASYARRFPTLGLIILVSVAPGAIGLSYMFLLPVVIRDLGANPGAIGLLYVGGGIGGLLAGLTAEQLMRRVGHGRTIFVGMGLIGVGLISVGLSGALIVAAVAIGVAQGGFAIYGSSSLSLVQSLSPARLRGRVTSLFTLLYWGLMPFGALVGGLVAERSSALFAVALAGAIVIACGVLLFLVRPQIATLRIDRVAGTVNGRLDGSGYSPPPRIEPTL